ncbi:CDP-alcohol phosphatidyltransferase family protein [Desulfococcus sp.]|uniref:CDP-alcohol phosphatidyltransferase family protein n=1 Tax=Desulfococcus sp. TaxID=2025834 RepID=UPI0035941B91
MAYTGLAPAQRRSARLVGGGFLAALVAGVILVSLWGGLSLGMLWLGTASAAAAWIYRRFLRLLPMNRPGDGGQIYGDLGAANRITLLRGGLVALLAGFALVPWPRMTAGGVPWPWIPGMLYGAAVLLDGVDGRIARKTGCVTRMGEQLDMETDALGLLAASMVAVIADRLPPAYLVAGMAYYLFSAGIRFREFLGKPVQEVRPWRGAKIIAGFQMAFVALALLPPVSPKAAAIAAWMVMIPLLAGFGRDWMIVCGQAGNDCFAGFRCRPEDRLVDRETGDRKP